MPGRKRKYVFDDGARLGNRAEQKICLQRIRRHTGRDAAAGHQRANFRSEQESSIGKRIVERFYSQAVTSKKYPRLPRGVSGSAGLASIPDGKSEHAAEFAQAILAPLFVGV